MINHRFMWVDDYFHYADWEQLQRATYDSFNLMPLPRKEGETKYFYDKKSHRRIIPEGIFPPPTHKRVILRKEVEPFNLEQQKMAKMGASEMNLYERDPYKSMI